MEHVDEHVLLLLFFGLALHTSLARLALLARHHSFTCCLLAAENESLRVVVGVSLGHVATGARLRKYFLAGLHFERFLSRESHTAHLSSRAFQSDYLRLSQCKLV